MGMGTLMGVLMVGGVSEGTLHKWFKGSKSKVVKVDGSTSSWDLRNDEPGKNTEMRFFGKSKHGKAKDFLLKEERKNKIQDNKKSLVLQNQLTLQPINQKRKRK